MHKLVRLEILSKEQSVAVYLGQVPLCVLSLVGITRAREYAAAIDKELAGIVEAKEKAYDERNRLVAVLSKMFPSHLCRHPKEDKDWDDEWRWIICIHTPVGQMTWHIQDKQMALLMHLSPGENHWDGHTTEDKYQRLEKLEGPGVQKVFDRELAADVEASLSGLLYTHGEKCSKPEGECEAVKAAKNTIQNVVKKSREGNQSNAS